MQSTERFINDYETCNKTYVELMDFQCIYLSLMYQAKDKLRKTEKALRKVQEDLEPAELPMDLETLSNEERFLFRKIGLSMKPFLLLGMDHNYDY